MVFFRIVWGIDIIVLLIALAFFAIGIGDGDRGPSAPAGKRTKRRASCATRRVSNWLA